ncbi:MAG TPA: class I SAM-dependent methyltransferase [Bacteroidota bacterium]|nr:class I SAM-dependent methyltransferase [Bacteroidota bacterium]
MSDESGGLTSADENRRAFDAAAPVYDAEYEDLPGIRRMRAATHALYLKYFSPGARLLEINCGTGTDALFLARHSMRVMATDLSASMIDQVHRKADAAGLAGSVEARQLSFGELGALRGSVFDGAYSNFGGLNCTDALEDVARNLGALLHPGGIFIASVMPRFSLSETAAFLSHLHLRSAFRRLSRGPVMARFHGAHVATYYHSHRAFRSAFRERFVHLETVGLAVLTPPPNFTRANRRAGITLLEHLDRWAAPLPLFRVIGDHYAIVLRRIP